MSYYNNMSSGIYILAKPGVNLANIMYDRASVVIDSFGNCYITLMEGAVYLNVLVIDFVKTHPVNTLTLFLGKRNVKKLVVPNDYRGSVKVINGTIDNHFH